jgi:mRNA-degrading endonuclease RelE of RelBE toxin-antitoxin system
MRYEILLAPEAVEDLNNLKVNVRAEVREAMERHLRHEPQKVSKSRIKRLRGVSRSLYRLRVRNDVRVFYDVSEGAVEVLGIVPKSEAEEWLIRYGDYDEASGSV